MNRHHPLFTRHAANPILTAKDRPYPLNSVFNPSAALLPNGSTLLCRVEDRRGLSQLCAARSLNGVDGWQIATNPALSLKRQRLLEKLWGIEDPPRHVYAGARAIYNRLRAYSLDRWRVRWLRVHGTLEQQRQIESFG
jgi:predicted GH43/DUF377 family glycosyl hydrolase